MSTLYGREGGSRRTTQARTPHFRGGAGKLFAAPRRACGAERHRAARGQVRVAVAGDLGIPPGALDGRLFSRAPEGAAPAAVTLFAPAARARATVPPPGAERAAVAGRLRAVWGGAVVARRARGGGGPFRLDQEGVAAVAGLVASERVLPVTRRDMRRLLAEDGGTVAPAARSRDAQPGVARRGARVACGRAGAG